MTPDIFLSYTREDVGVAQTYRDALLQEGFEVWWDATLRSGETYDEVTETALRGAKAVVVLWSPRSVASRWVRAEATIAHRKQTLAPVMIEPCERPVMFELTQTADLSHWRGSADDEAWLAFLEDVRRMVGRSGPDCPTAATSPVPTPADAGVPNVAMLPLTHRQEDEDLERLAEDLTEEITRELAQTPYFKVIAAGTMAARRGDRIDYRVLGRDLDARYLMEGKLQRVGDEVRLTVQLIDADAASIVWSPRFGGKEADLAASLEEFPMGVAAQLGEHIVQIEMKRAMAKPGPFSGWEHLLRAEGYIAHVGPDSLRRAVEEARHAVAAAPDLGLAHAALAMALALFANVYGDGIDDGLSREIHTHIERAIQLDGDNSIVIAHIGHAYSGLGDGDTCLRLARRAAALNPNSPLLKSVLGLAYFALGRTGEAIAALEEDGGRRSMVAGRHSSLAMLGACYWLEGEAGEAEAAIDRSLALHPNWDIALKWKAVLAAHRGEEAAAHDIVRRLRKAEPTKSVDQHVRQVFALPLLRERLVGAAVIFRQLWDATEGQFEH